MRYAIYHAPSPAAPLWQAASRWLGRDAATGLAWPLDAGNGFSAARLGELTADPRRYGFHATLKAPFELADTKDEDMLLAAFEAFAADQPAALIDPLVIGRLGPFFALVPGGPTEETDALADAAVMAFEPFRKALSEADIARRKPDELTAPQRSNLMQWGYPYVFEEFRFHMTLTGPVPTGEQDAMAVLLAERFSAFADKPHVVDHLALFRESRRGGDFEIIAAASLAHPTHRKSA